MHGPCCSPQYRPLHSSGFSKIKQLFYNVQLDNEADDNNEDADKAVDFTVGDTIGCTCKTDVHLNICKGLYTDIGLEIWSSTQATAFFGQCSGKLVSCNWSGSIPICHLLGLHSTQLHVIRQSNYHPEIQLLFQTLSSLIKGDLFPELDWVLTGRHPTLMFCKTISLGAQIHAYLFNQSCPVIEIKIFGCIILSIGIITMWKPVNYWQEFLARLPTVRLVLAPTRFLLVLICLRLQMGFLLATLMIQMKPFRNLVGLHGV